MKSMKLITPVRLFTLLFLLASLTACQTTKNIFGIDDKVAETETLAVEPLYALGKADLDDKDYEDAIIIFTRLIARFPYGPLTEQAQVDLAYAQFKAGKSEEAISSIDRFIRTYPTAENIDYAYYLKALINFDRENRWLAKVARLDVSARDLGAATQSYNDFNEVVRRFPSSKYAEESRQRMIYLRNRLALHEVTVGLYYYDRQAYVSAIGRAKYVLETYPQSEFEDDAIALLAVSYKALGQDQLAKDSTSVLQTNYADHPYLAGKWPTKRSKWSQLNPFAGEVKN
ncbi:MAG: outer membrane protein assembly factor BamD [Arenimonas sp.]|nr:outer membrane protein assembly factor BamD [Arenimonas sp.]